ncbi:MAG: SpoIID/LytB domain-containing protein, partial [Phycisphaerales bacterium]|nr:SpoIID/LytB domain-containing protein [Phycisphaerales bacterium]
MTRMGSGDLEGRTGIDIPRRSLLATIATGVVLGPAACRGVREDSSTVPAKPVPKDNQANTPFLAEPDLRPVPPQFEPSLRVRVATVRQKAGRSPEPIVIGAQGQRLWVTTPQLRQPGRALSGPLQVRAMDGGWVLETSGRLRQGRERLETATPLAIAPIGGDAVVFDGASVRGVLHITRRTDLKTGECDVVTHLPMEEYLPGVLEHELYSSWPRSTFEAQAIAARSFACCERNFWINRRHFDVVAGQASQAWSGGQASRRAVEAVRGTEGKVLVWDGRVVPAYYSAACGGLPASASDAIGGNPVNKIPPLVVADVFRKRVRGCCEASPHAQWSVDFNAEQVRTALRDLARNGGPSELRNLDRIRGIEVVDRNPAGRPTRYRVRSVRNVEIDAGALRKALNAVRSSTRGEARLKSSCIEFVLTSRGIRAEGRGFGHGVGLCQYGARTMGNSGATAVE